METNTQTPEYRLEDKKVYRGKKHAATIQADGTLKPATKHFTKYLEEIKTFLLPAGFIAKEEEPVEPAPEPTNKATPEELSANFEAFAQSFATAKPMARKIFFKNNRAFFEEYQSSFEEVFDFEGTTDTETQPTRKKSPTIPPKHPDEPDGGIYGDAHPDVYDWRKANWKEEDFRKTYLHRHKGIARLRTELDGEKALEKLREFQRANDLTNPEIKEPARIVSEAFKVVDLERKNPGATALLTEVENLNNLTPVEA